MKYSDLDSVNFLIKRRADLQSRIKEVLEYKFAVMVPPGTYTFEVGKTYPDGVELMDAIQRVLLDYFGDQLKKTDRRLEELDVQVAE